jgi:hypothetical protein
LLNVPETTLPVTVNDAAALVTLPPIFVTTTS